MRSKHDALVMVVANSKSVDEEVRWLEAGADDFLRKPFYPSQLRQKIEPDPAAPRYILTIPGVGYTLIHPVDEEIRV
jgi:DNA-binding response OmpR family regulator